MNARLLRGVGIAASALALALSQPASAAPGDGIRLGGSAGTLHPFVDIDAKYDTNATTTSTGAAEDLILHIRPGLKLNVPGDLVAVDALAAVERVQYLGLVTDTSELSDWWADAGLRLSINRKGRVGFELRDSFRRSTQVQAMSLGIPAVSNYNSLAATLPFMPGGGALIFAVGADWAVETYAPVSDDPAGTASTQLDGLGYNEFQGRGSAVWKFLPRTRATLDAGFFQRLPNDTAISPEVSGLRVLAGLSGLVTTQIGATLRAGFGSTFGDTSYKTWLATVEGEWLPVAEASVRVGYNHGIGTDPGREFSVYATNRVFVDGRYQVARRFTAQTEVRFDQISYHAGTDTKSQVVVVEPSVDAEVTKWMRASVGYAFTKRSSTGANSSLSTFNYDRHEVFVRASVNY